MSSSLRRGALAASAIVFSIASLAACGAGNNSQTLQIKPDNAAVSVGKIKIQNALVITQPDLKSTGPAVVSATIFNTGTTDETLQSITVGSTSAELKDAKGQSLTVPAHGSLLIGGQGNASAVLASGREAVQDGNVQKVTFTLSKSGAVSLSAFVVPATSYFSKWGPNNIPSAPATASASPAPGATASSAGKPGKASPSATASETATTGAAPSDSASQSAAGH
ncbi:copper chaperone PCu(A)C [Streptomyces sp. NK08204]|uniref:copper chaperone PCu(A)C n=1 Tax=Streptomyces sp. NK08204 TaxID=2873260 RepID=UPI001CED60DE|nr:copper chaperone PCu(A)C [Streptomyces sp. NK08204]